MNNKCNVSHSFFFTDTRNSYSYQTMLAPLLADLFLYSCEANVMQRLLMESEKKLAQTLFAILIMYFHFYPF